MIHNEILWLIIRFFAMLNEQQNTFYNMIKCEKHFTNKFMNIFPPNPNSGVRKSNF